MDREFGEFRSVQIWKTRTSADLEDPYKRQLCYLSNYGGRKSHLLVPFAQGFGTLPGRRQTYDESCPCLSVFLTIALCASPSGLQCWSRIPWIGNEFNFQ